jgi:ubiquinone/menaquinone biosynthesis C-methylase UbiE
MTRKPHRLPQISHFYDGIADGGWGDSDYFTYSARFPTLRHWVAAELPAASRRILSIGCGAGELERHLAKAHRHRIVGLDASQRMLARARNGGLHEVVQADSHTLPFADGSFDVVMFVECIGHLRMATAFDEARRVLKRRGRLLVTTYSPDVEVHDGYAKTPPSELAASLTDTGFRVEPPRFLKARGNGMAEVPEGSDAALICVWATKKS